VIEEKLKIEKEVVECTPRVRQGNKDLEGEN
jgi:hypothetical protein